MLVPELNQAELRVYFKNILALHGRAALYHCIGEIIECGNIGLSVLSESAAPATRPWDWPFLRYNFGGDREYACAHGIGHSSGIHGCEGCCSDPNFPGRRAPRAS